MSFFFDAWTKSGFVLASDVYLLENDSKKQAHKLFHSNPRSQVKCAMAVCGEYPVLCNTFFVEACMRKDNLRDIAKHFAHRWVERFGGTTEYSAVHIVGFEHIHDLSIDIPQMWFWCNWGGKSEDDYPDKDYFLKEFESFTEIIPRNNHIPYKIKELTGLFPDPNYESEYKLVRQFLQDKHYFTWNGDTKFWRDALDKVGAEMNQRVGANRTLDEVSEILRNCILRLEDQAKEANVGTITSSTDRKIDILQITPNQINKYEWANI